MVTIKILVSILSGLGLILFLCRLWRIPALATPFVSICIVILIHFICGILSLLQLAPAISVSFGLTAGVYAVRSGNAPWFGWRADSLTLLGFLIIPILFWTAIPSNYVFLEWDELSFWAKCQRLIYDTNEFLTSNSPIAYKTYPPGAPLFQYYITVMMGWAEKHVLFAQALVCFSAIAAAVAVLTTDRLAALFGYFFACTLIYFFGANYVTVYSDALLALSFAACLALATKTHRCSADDVALGICLAATCLIKETAVLFALVVIFVYSVNILFEENAKSVLLSKIDLLKGFLRRVSIAAFPSVVVLFVWHLYVLSIDAGGMRFEFPAASTLTQEPFRLRVGTTLVEFYQRLVRPGYFIGYFESIGFNYSLLKLVGFLTLFSGLLVIFDNTQMRLKLSAIYSILFISCVGYLLFLLFTYVFFFTEYEGIRLASFERYSQSFMLMWVVYLTAQTTRVIADLGYKKSFITQACLLMAAIAFVPPKLISDFSSVKLDPQLVHVRESISALADIVKRHASPGDKVYFIAQNTNGYEKVMFDYSMIPEPSANCWSVGEPYGSQDVWTCRESLSRLLMGYKYLVIFKADEAFWSAQHIQIRDDGPATVPGVFKINNVDAERIDLTRIK